MAKKKEIFKISQMDAKTLSWWRSRRARIDMSPPYQRRGKLWSVTDKAYLIDSILNSFDVPKLYIADFTYGDSALNRKRLPYAIIDGKQRFEAIFDFYDGTITLNDDFVFRENASLKLAGLGYQDLVKNYGDVAEIFDNFNLTVMSVVSTSEELINELFVRLNRNKPLTGAEIRNAMTGPAPELFRKVSQHEFFTNYVAFNIQRGQDLNAAAKLIMFEYNQKFSETKKRNMDFFTRTFSKQIKPTERARLELAARKVLDTVDIMTEVFLPRDRLLLSSGTLPVYYWLVRSVPSKDQRFIRPFLIRFEEERKENRQLTSLEPGSRYVDHQLTEFDEFNRSTNDLASHKGRFQILADRFKIYLREYKERKKATSN